MSKEAIEHYEAALKEAFPSGATGDVFHHWNEARKALVEQPAPMIRGDIRDGLVDDEPAQQEPVAVPTTSYEHRKFVLVGRDWYERFAAFHDDCQIGEQLTWQEKTIRQQGYENGWNDAQRYLKEPQSTSPTPAQQEPVAWRVKVETKLRDGSVDFGYQLRNERLSKYDEPLYTSPPAQRTWVGLTRAERFEIEKAMSKYYDYQHECKTVCLPEFARAIEAKLRERNT